jgi:hypothetical protein
VPSCVQDGWGYAATFATSLFEHEWADSPGMLDVVRQRRWFRRMSARKTADQRIAEARDMRDARAQRQELMGEDRGYTARAGGGGAQTQPPIDPKTVRVTSRGVETNQGTLTAEAYVNRLHQDNSSSLDRTIQALQQSDDLADDNLNKLRKQTEQMAHIDGELKDIEHTMDASDRIVKSLFLCPLAVSVPHAMSVIVSTMASRALCLICRYDVVDRKAWQYVLLLQVRPNSNARARERKRKKEHTF